MRYAFHPDYSTRSDAKYPYIASFSPMLRAAVQFMGKKEAIAVQIEGIVEEVACNEEVASSIKKPIIEGQNVRQVDLKNDDGMVLVKCFVGWDHHKGIWVVWAEGAQERHWEDEFTSNYDPWEEK